MSENAIQVTNLGKKYHIGKIQQQQTIAQTALQIATAPVRRMGNLLRGKATAAAELNEEFWALNDINFEVPKGQILGVIGHNGAGKSTLLKILSRITSPDTGRVELNGVVGSLLEVGTGFHPELTGRENVYMNSAILGMTRADVNRKFDEIVEFAGVGKFIDTPVKHYSSGMYVRLAFGVAAHMETEILLIDEVLAVGDAEFQRKSLAKMEEVSTGQGRTVLFVSHNMGSIQALCDRALLLNGGQIIADGKPIKVIEKYQDTLGGKHTSYIDLTQWTNRGGNQDIGQFTSISLHRANGELCDTFQFGENIVIRLGLQYKDRVNKPEIGLVISNQNRQRICHIVSTWEEFIEPVTSGEYVYEILIPSPNIVPGMYDLTMWLKPLDNQAGGSADFIDGSIHFEIIEGLVDDRAIPFHIYCKPGEVYMRSKWSLQPNK